VRFTRQSIEGLYRHDPDRLLARHRLLSTVPAVRAKFLEFARSGRRAAERGLRREPRTTTQRSRNCTSRPPRSSTPPESQFDRWQQADGEQDLVGLFDQAMDALIEGISPLAAKQPCSGQPLSWPSSTPSASCVHPQPPRRRDRKLRVRSEGRPLRRRPVPHPLPLRPSTAASSPETVETFKPAHMLAAGVRHDDKQAVPAKKRQRDLLLPCQLVRADAGSDSAGSRLSRFRRAPARRAAGCPDRSRRRRRNRLAWQKQRVLDARRPRRGRRPSSPPQAAGRVRAGSRTSRAPRGHGLQTEALALGVDHETGRRGAPGTSTCFHGALTG